MLKHEHFEELCAAASIGQATPEELFELEQHAAGCEACQRAYWAYLNVAARQFAKRVDDPRLSAREAQDSLNSELFTRRFLERAEKEGIVFSQDVETEARKMSPRSDVLPRHIWWFKPALGVVASILIIGMVGASYFHGKRAVQKQSDSVRTAKLANEPSNNGMTGTLEVLKQRIVELSDMNRALQAQLDATKAERLKENIQLNAASDRSHSESEDRKKLEVQRDTLDAKIHSIEQELADSRMTVAKVQQESLTLKERADGLEGTLVADQSKIADLTDELKDKSSALEKEQQLLSVGHDVTDLMGARNLHIVDVVDTDTRGKTRPAFGRIFFTEGKSLLFYAYDLNENKIQKADYQYRVWAKREGQDKQVRNLGIFYSDDKSQRRWVFKCTDPQVLNDIDSVFVTLEPSQGDPSHPHGVNLMYAYLRGQANHP